MSPLSIYKASAGSGKTYALTLEYLRLLFLYPGKHRHILAVTFTNKAAGEMKQRILSWLHKLSKLGEDDLLSELSDLMHVTGRSREEIIRNSGVLLDTILNDYSYFSVGTIDRFFQTVIRAFTRDIGIQPGYNLELDTSRVLGIAVDNMFMKISGDSDLQEWLIRYAEDRIEEARSWNFRDDIIKLGRQLFREEFQALHIPGENDILDKVSLHNFRKELEGIEKEANQKISELSLEALDKIEKAGYTLSDFSGGSRSTASYFHSASTDPGYKLSKARIEAISEKSKWLKKDSTAALEKLVVSELQPRLKSIYETSFVANSCLIIRKNLYTMGILKDISESIKEYSIERNIFLLNDASRFLKGIIADNPAPFIFERVGNRYENIMLDEFQDTSMFQWENFKPLLENSLAKGEDNLVVGDIKQSIYRWRNSDWRILATDVINDFRHQELHTRTLSNNFRSKEEVIRFNNTLFQIAPGIIRDVLSNEFEDSGFMPDEAKAWLDLFETAYDDVVQLIPDGRDTKGGYVSCQIHDSENSGSFYKRALEWIPSQIELLESRGIKPGEIAILVRKQDEGSMVAAKLLEYARTDKGSFDFNLVSNESLIISGNISVMLIIGLLRYFVFPSDHLNRAELKFTYYKFTADFEGTIQSVFDSQTSMDAILPEDLICMIPKLKKMPIYELVERIILILGIDKRTDDVAYVQALQDMIIDLQRNDPITLFSFLHYWEEKGHRKSVSISEEMDAIRIMTIHKSKGLQFKAVIVPFCNWEITTDSRKENILWCDTSNTPFNKVPLVPVRFSSSLKQSIFLSEYIEEMVKGYLDNLNLLYVALTRSVDALLIGLPESSDGRLKTVGDLVVRTFSIHAQKEPCVPGWTSLLDKQHFSYGELKSSPGDAVPVAEWKFDQYPVFIRNEKLMVKLRSQAYFLNPDGKLGSKIDFGNIMHEIYAGINNIDDVDSSLRKVAMEGLIRRDQESGLADTIRESLSQPGVSEWFEKDLKVSNEQDILMAGGDVYRPDRVVFKDDMAIVIDFKFGETKKSTYNKQVARYVSLLQEMQYSKVKGYIWYVTLNDIVSVN